MSRRNKRNAPDRDERPRARRKHDERKCTPELQGDEEALRLDLLRGLRLDIEPSARHLLLALVRGLARARLIRGGALRELRILFGAMPSRRGGSR